MDNINDDKTITDIEENESFCDIKFYNLISKYYDLNSNKTKIILSGHSCEKGGAEILLKNLIKEFRKQDVEIVVLVKSDGPLRAEYEKFAPTFIIDTFEKSDFYINELYNLGYGSAILNTVICGDLIPIFHKYFIYTVSLVHELPCVIKKLNAYNHCKIISDSADLTIFPSSFVADKFESLFKIKNQKLVQPQGFYNSYDDNFNKKESRLLIEEEYGIPKENKILLNVGRGELRKGFDLFVDVAKKLKNENFSLIWVGSIDEDMKQKFLSECCNDKNIIVPGFISDKNEIMRFYDACDIFMLTSREDPFPSVVLEAFNAKRPVVAFENAGGFCDIVINNETGFLVEYESTDALIDKIKLICNDEDLKKLLGENAKKVCNQFSFHEYVKILTVYCLNGEQILSLENSINLLENDLMLYKDKVSYLENNLYSKNNKISILNEENQQKVKTLQLKDNEILELKQKNISLTKEKNQILSSSSWKVTKPIRDIKYNAQKVFKQDKNNNLKNNNPKKNKSNKSKHNLLTKNSFSLIQTYPYPYKVYYLDDSIKRVNLFFDSIDESIYKLNMLFPFIIKYCNEYQHVFRIIYNNADFEIFKKFLKDFNLNLPENISFLNLKNENYIEVGYNEKYICTSWNVAKKLNDVSNINEKIYYYLDDLSQTNSNEYFKIVKMCHNENIIVLNDNLNKLNQLNDFSYDYFIEINKKSNNEYKILCCDFGDMIIEGIELLNYLFLNNVLKINEWEIYLVNGKKLSKIYCDSNNFIKHTSKKLDNYDLFLKIDISANANNVEKEGCIGININVSNYDLDIINISNIEDTFLFDLIHSKNNESEYLIQIVSFIEEYYGV